MTIINKEEQEFLDVLRNIVDNGIEDNNDRTGVGIKFLPGVTLKYDLRNNKLPLWTTRKVKWSNQFIELVWFLRGQTDVKFLQDRGINIWDSWVKEDGTIGPGYGKQWRTWEKYVSDGHGTVYRDQPIDQFKNLITGIKNKPSSRRHIVSLWNVPDMEHCKLPCCHGDIIQFIVDPNTKELHCLQYQRSADFTIGYCPWQYTMLTHIVASLTNTIPASFTATLGNCHVYINQLDAIKEQLSRTPSESPTFKILKPLTSIQDVENLQLEDVEVSNYNPQKFIRFPIAV